MTSAVIAMLVSDGVLDYDKPVREYLPDLTMADDPVASQQMTLRDMLCHRSGLAPHDGIWPSDCTAAEFENRFAYLMPIGPFPETKHSTAISYTHWQVMWRRRLPSELAGSYEKVSF